jgi:4-amino-4-deoxy-L-arabinose transferase-like glycosyltransferase
MWVSVVVDLLVIGLVVWVVYFSRLAELPLAGEEPRRTEVAREMVRSGDYIVPRQQGQIYRSRPPLQNWLIAALALLRGQWDAYSVRLPSALATSTLVLLIYGYTWMTVGRLAGLAAAISLATMGQMMHIGGLGETDPLFALLLGGALLLWHGTGLAGWNPTASWALGGLLAGLAGLAKGVQGPVSFFLVTGTWWGLNLVRKGSRWQQLLGPVCGVLCCGAVVAAWTIPYYLSTDFSSTWQIWWGQVVARVGGKGMLENLVTKPIETLVCWLPWTPLLAAYLWPSFWRALDSRKRDIARFWLWAIAVTFPTIWFASESRNRYFLGLYPASAFLVGLVVHQLGVEVSPGALARLWSRFLGAMTIVCVAVVAGAFAAVVLSPQLPFPVAWGPWNVLGFALVVAACVVIWTQANRAVQLGNSATGPGLVLWTKFAVLAVGISTGLLHILFVHASWVAIAQDPGPQIAAVRRAIPCPEQLVSFGPVFARFRYFYELPIRQLNFPRRPEDVPAGVTYFCLEGTLYRERTGGDLSTVLRGIAPSPIGLVSLLQTRSGTRAGERGQATPEDSRGSGVRLEAPELPFDWELLAVIPCGRTQRERVQPAVIVGKIRRSAALADNPAAQKAPRR